MSSPYVDVARGVLQQAVAGAQDALTTAQEKLDEYTHKHHLRSLMADLGEAYYAEQREGGSHRAVEDALETVGTHLDVYGGSEAEPDPAAESAADGVDPRSENGSAANHEG